MKTSNVGLIAFVLGLAMFEIGFYIISPFSLRGWLEVHLMLSGIVLGFGGLSLWAAT